jgi:glycosyltransferase involved in cell wall biosynthesis
MGLGGARLARKIPKRRERLLSGMEANLVMRILHLIPQISAGGAERQLNCLAAAMAKACHEVHIAYVQDGPESVPLPGVVLHRLNLSGNHDPSLFIKLLRLTRTIDPDIIQSWILMMDIAAGFLSFTTKAAWVLREPTSEAAYRGFNLKQELRSRLAQRAAAIVCNSPGGKSYWLGQGIHDNRLSVIPNAVPLDSLDGIEPMQNERDTRKVLIYAGRLMISKNVDIVINAIAEARWSRDVILYIAGDGPAKPYLMRLVDRLKAWETVKFVGFLPSPDLWARIKAADAFISMSGYEGMPNCVCEAIACGVPLILSDIPAHRAFLDDDSAVLIPVTSAPEVAERIWLGLNNTQEAVQRSTRALARIKDLTTEAIAAHYVDLYAKLLTDERVKL